MPTITLETDPSSFKVEVLGKGFYEIDAFALQHAIAKRKPPSLAGKLADDMTVDEALQNFEAVVEAARELTTKDGDDGKTPKEKLGLTDSELFAMGSKVVAELDRLGK